MGAPKLASSAYKKDASRIASLMMRMLLICGARASSNLSQMAAVLHTLHLVLMETVDGF